MLCIPLDRLEGAGRQRDLANGAIDFGNGARVFAPPRTLRIVASSSFGLVFAEHAFLELILLKDRKSKDR